MYWDLSLVCAFLTCSIILVRPRVIIGYEPRAIYLSLRVLSCPCCWCGSRSPFSSKYTAPSHERVAVVLIGLVGNEWVCASWSLVLADDIMLSGKGRFLCARK